jgi:hypothetical protein
VTQAPLSPDWPHDQGVDEPSAPVASFFEADFWQHYPRKSGKLDAIKAWKQLNPDASLRLVIADHLARRVWPREKRFIPLPGSFLRGYRWTDEVDKEGHASAAGPANRWHPSHYASWCDHDPRCSCPETHALILAREKTDA